MMIATPSRQVIVVAGLFLLFEWTWVLLRSPSRTEILGLPSLQTTGSEDIFDYPPVESNAIKDICAATEWNDDLIFTCEDSTGGVADVRNTILTCLRFTIAAGARLVLPHIILPNDDRTPDSETPVRTDLNYMFDQQHFLKSLHLSCPQLHIFHELDSVPDLASMHDPLPLRPEDLQSPFPATGVPRPGTWRADFRAWLDSQTSTRVPARGTSIINLARSPPVYPVSSDSAAFAHDFSTLLNIRPDVRKLATTAFHALIDKFNLDTVDSTAIAKDAYLGAYLITEGAVAGYTASDAIHFFETLKQDILNQTLSANLAVLYLTTSYLHTENDFSDSASPLGIHVVTKFNLLPESDSVALLDMTLDQQALVDFLLLGRASQFAGVRGNAFSWSVALGRGGKGRQENKGVERETLRDSLSRIYGEGGREDGFERCLWS